MNASSTSNAWDVATPALLVELDVLSRNVAQAADIAHRAGMALRPHAKTHKSPLVAHMQLDAGASGICCAKLSEAEVMLQAGVNDIHITTPVVDLRRIDLLCGLAASSRLSVVIDSAVAARNLSVMAVRHGVRVGAIIEVDVGQHRCGVEADDAADLAETISALPGLAFLGVQGYNGRIQMQRDVGQRRQAALESADRLRCAIDQICNRGLSVDRITGGGTGTLAFDIELGLLNECQPGSYVFMDSRYGEIGWPPSGRPPFSQAMFVLATVISLSRSHAVLDCGWKSISCDGGPPILADESEATFRFAGDEHGILDFEGANPFQLGDKVRLVPSHCDTTVNLHDRYIGVRGERIETQWPVAARGMSQ